MTKLSTVVFVSVAACAFGCGPVAAEKQVPAEYALSFASGKNLFGDAPYLFVVQGKEFKESQRVTLKAEDLKGKRIDSPGLIAAKVQLPEGWIEVPVEIRPDPSPNLQGVLHIAVNFGPESDRCLLTCFVDNRGRAAGKLSVGQLSFNISADAEIALEFPAPATPQTAALRIDGRELANLPIASQILKEHPKEYHSDQLICLIDPSGLRKYESFLQGYGGVETSPPMRKRHVEKHFHVIGSFHYTIPVDRNSSPAVSDRNTHLRIDDVK